MLRVWVVLLCVLIVLVSVAVAVNAYPVGAEQARNAGTVAVDAQSDSGGEENSAPARGHTFTLQTGIVDGRMVYLGLNGDIAGVANPDLVARAGSNVRLNFINGDGMAHDLAIPELDVKSPLIAAKGASAEVAFTVTTNQRGVHEYFCSVSGHRQAGMEGRLIVE